MAVQVSANVGSHPVSGWHVKLKTGATATLTAVDDATAATPQGQWVKNKTKIAGATNATYDIVEDGTDANLGEYAFQSLTGQKSRPIRVDRALVRVSARVHDGIEEKEQRSPWTPNPGDVVTLTADDGATPQAVAEGIWLKDDHLQPLHWAGPSRFNLEGAGIDVDILSWSRIGVHRRL